MADILRFGRLIKQDNVPGILACNERFDTTNCDPNQWRDTLEFARREVSEELSKHWSEDGGTFYLTRGSTTKELVVSLEDVEEEEGGLRRSIDNFSAAYGKVLGRGIKHSDGEKEDSAGLADCFV